MVRTYKDFEKWVKVQTILQDKTQRSLAQQMGIAYPRISEALHGKITGKAHIVPLIQALNGNLDEFTEFFEEIDISIQKEV